MIVAFLGKGGSGKSTLATALVEHWLTSGKHVLAVDADHNMDLSYNLGAEPSVFLGTHPSRIKEYLGVTSEHSFADARRAGVAQGTQFRISPPDPFTAAVSSEVRPRLRLITAGPHTDTVRSGEHCSHSLAAPLKAYLPLLELKPDERVVIDERAGTDPVATGILNGVTLAVIVREPTRNSERVAEQIRHELELAQVPHVVVDNKQNGIEADATRAIETIEKLLGQ